MGKKNVIEGYIKIIENNQLNKTIYSTINSNLNIKNLIIMEQIIKKQKMVEIFSLSFAF